MQKFREKNIKITTYLIPGFPNIPELLKEVQKSLVFQKFLGFEFAKWFFFPIARSNLGLLGLVFVDTLYFLHGCFPRVVRNLFILFLLGV